MEYMAYDRYHLVVVTEMLRVRLPALLGTLMTRSKKERNRVAKFFKST